MLFLSPAKLLYSMLGGLLGSWELVRLSGPQALQFNRVNRQWTFAVHFRNQGTVMRQGSDARRALPASQFTGLSGNKKMTDGYLLEVYPGGWEGYDKKEANSIASLVIPETAEVKAQGKDTKGNEL
jgi:hypothetical protein